MLAAATGTMMSKPALVEQITQLVCTDMQDVDPNVKCRSARVSSEASSWSE